MGRTKEKRLGGAENMSMRLVNPLAPEYRIGAGEMKRGMLAQSLGAAAGLDTIVDNLSRGLRCRLQQRGRRRR